MAENLTLVQAMLRKMEWLEKRQQVLAENIANADTPGYRPQDIKPIEFKDLLESSTSSLSLGSGGIATTNAKHLGSDSTSSSGGNTKETKQKSPYEIAPSGNAVILEEQLLKMNQNYTDHRMISNLYQKNVEMLKMATRSQ